jgi:hypothetical protein
MPRGSSNGIIIKMRSSGAGGGRIGVICPLGKESRPECSERVSKGNCGLE